jgi:hypothetical protein
MSGLALSNSSNRMMTTDNKRIQLLVVGKSHLEALEGDKENQIGFVRR